MKKLLAMALAFGLVASLGLTACGNKDEGAKVTCDTATIATKNDTAANCKAAGGKFTDKVDAVGTTAAKPATCACKEG
jgi:hypothetical protein